MWAEGKKRKNRVEFGRRNAEVGIFRLKIWDCGMGRRAEGSKLKAESRGQRIEERRQRKEGEKLGR
jgi:hypothetical protein